MFWIFLISALVLIAMGIDALDLAKYTREPTDIELDEMLVGKGLPPLPQASRDHFRNQLGISALVRFPNLLGIFFIVAGLICSVLAYLSHSST